MKETLLTCSFLSRLLDFTVPASVLTSASSWGALWEFGIGGRGALRFFGISDGRVLESYCLLTLLDLVVNVGLGLLINGVAGALAVLGFGWEKKNIYICYLNFLENIQQYWWITMNMFIALYKQNFYILLVLFFSCFVEKSWKTLCFLSLLKHLSFQTHDRSLK